MSMGIGMGNRAGPKTPYSSNGCRERRRESVCTTTTRVASGNSIQPGAQPMHQ